MYACNKFQLIWTTSDFWTKFAEKDIDDKNFEKINIKIQNKDIAMYPCAKF